MSQQLGSYLFSFAVISDSHVNEGENRSASPFRSNRLANGRFRHVVRDLNRRRPALTVHLGDMGNPLPHLASYEQAAANFKTVAAELKSPLFLVPGNHCVGDKPTGWVPVPRVGQASLDRFERTYGQHFYSFEHGPCHFVVINSSIVNSGLEIEAEQRTWVERDLARADGAGKRLWLLMHYPPYLATPNELGSYDNVDEPGRSWLLGLLERFGVEAVLSGHVHHYFFNRYAGTDLYTVPATSFVRQDYAELFRVEPAGEEGGRDDPEKLGYCLVSIFENGYHHEVIRTHGRTAPTDATEEAFDTSRQDPDHWPAHGNLGVEMRENWLRRTALRTNNSVSPFTRRAARNDWAVLALKEMGLSRVRLSLQELDKEDAVERMAALQEAGFEFIVYSHGTPREAEYRLVREHRALLAGWELILYRKQIVFAARQIAKIRGSLSSYPLPFYLNEVREIDRQEIDDANVKHQANYGFGSTDREALRELVRRSSLADSFAGLVFRLRRTGQPEAMPWSAIRAISETGREWGMRHQVHILFSGNLTSDRLVDDLSTANRVAESSLAGVLASNVDLYFDTFEDVDRGYFVRNGLVDRSYNPRPAARVLRNLCQALARRELDGLSDSSAKNLPDGRLLTVEHGQGALALAMPEGAMRLETLDVSGKVEQGSLIARDLESGIDREVAVEVADAEIRLVDGLTIRKPTLLLFGPRTG